ncbi:hypothetical protein LK09_07215 [Microbacterium mangrovi]|uniref:DUF2993 domain-containing protein n=1 Tax=Microbacterium mangrovi TaxID=1348253 RepID=A0A0B2A6L6_9MICO|nr:DUF2993 domain-containing protein [Microbacterium mangrovi]KHK98710.1 hypothetical protein LK09_07215 [Microbacterium mangrovi]
MLLRIGDDENPKTQPLPSSGDATPTEQFAPLPVTMPLPANVPPRPGSVRPGADATGDGAGETPAADDTPAPDATPAPESAPAAEEPAAPSSLDAPTQAISPIGPATALPAQKRPTSTRPKQLAWSNLPNSEPIPLGAVAGGFDVTGTHPTLPPVSSYTAAIAAAATGAMTAPTATAPAASPAAETPETSEPDAPPSPAAKKRRRRRAVIVTLATTAVVLVLVGVAAAIGWQVAETHASSVVKQTVQQKVDKALGLPASHPVAVTFDEPVLPQTWAGKLDTLTFTVAGVPLVGTTGTITIHATDVPTNGTGVPATAEAKVRLKPDALQSLVSANRTTLGQILPETVKVDGNRVTVSLNPAQFLSGVSFTEVLKASIEGGNLVLTPEEFIVGGLPMSADTVRARFGGLAQGILASRTICLADTHPAGMTLKGLDVKKDAVVADFDVQPGILTDPALQAKGTCK